MSKRRKRINKIISGEAANCLIDFYNGFIAGKFKSSKANKRLIGDLAILFKLHTPQPYKSTYRSEFSRRKKYSFGDIVKVSTGNRYGIVPGFYVAMKNNPRDLPRHLLDPKGESKGWRFMETWPAKESLT